MPEVYNISMLGEFTITYGNKEICDHDNRSKKPWNLLEYIVTYRDREINQDELCDLLWQDEQSENPSGALKVLLHRVRKSLEPIMPRNGEEIILLKRGVYRWNPELTCVVDTDIFESLLNKASDTSLDSAERLSLYKQAFSLYKGDFLPRNSHASWVVPIAAYYHTLFVNNVYSAIDLLEADGKYSEVEQLTRYATSLDQTDEKLYFHLIQALYKSGRQQDALTLYNDATDMFYKKFGITPSDELKALYRLITKTTKSLETDLCTIKDALREKGEVNGAFFCEYEFFKDIYQLQARACARNGDSIYLCLLTLNEDNGDTPSMKVLNKAMDHLRIAIKETLRRGDVVARYSVSQYVMLLPTTTYENVEMIVKRITSSFYRKYVKKNVALQYKLQPLEPMQ